MVEDYHNQQGEQGHNHSLGYGYHSLSSLHREVCAGDIQSAHRGAARTRNGPSSRLHSHQRAGYDRDQVCGRPSADGHLRGRGESLSWK